ncbi:MAG: bifunctional [glutamine synthetase] adenylyltransferase/[glutamine synthetase]-adenylyl-L-tyrosine phosphorylase [Caulobacteraceae bacterium]
MPSENTTLARILLSPGPIIDGAAAERAREDLAEAAKAEGWATVLEEAWPALAPVFAASPYLAALARRRPGQLRAVLSEPPERHLGDILEAARACGGLAIETAEVRLRELKAELHLLAAIADLGGAWDLTAVTAALTAFADEAVATALALAAREARAAGRVEGVGHGEEGPLPGLFFVAMGKQGAFELNYSSDIDLCAFFEPDALPLASGIEPASFATRLVERVAGILQRRTHAGYVFRVDLRLRPDPSSTPAAVSVPAALEYYESVGQNWERAAFIKARVCAGDLTRGDAFLLALQPFIWRRNLDFAAIADIHSIKRQIQAHKIDERLTAAGADLKLGRGGIREIEFYVQTQQLILGGRHPGLRAPATLAALAALAGGGQVAEAAAGDLASAYKRLRGLEHRIQMVADEQTHRLPQSDAERRRVAALAGYRDLRAFDGEVGRLLKGVNRRYGELFAGEEPLSSVFGSLIFTGVDDDPETLATLHRMGFSDPAGVSRTIRGWHHGHIAATRTERGRELFTRLAPRLLEAARSTGQSDAAFARFGEFLSGLRSGVQVLSLFLAQPRLFEMIVRVMAFAPEFARALARRPTALDALLDPAFFGPLNPPADLGARLGGAGDFEEAMDLARRVHREEAFRIGVQILAGVASAEDAGRGFSELAEGIIRGLSGAALAEVERIAGRFAGDVAVVALGKCGSREMTARSDLDLMTLYRHADAGEVSSVKGWGADTFYARFTQRLVAALSAPTREGALYETDLQLRPSGTKGPVAVSLTAFEDYYAREAEVWELLAMTRARVVWASSEAFAAQATSTIEAALRRPRLAAATAAEATAMRILMAAERPPAGFWDMKLGEGGLVDIEFAAQTLQLIHAAAGGPLAQNTGEAMARLSDGGFAPRALVAELNGAWRLQRNLSQLLKVALPEDADPSEEPRPLRMLLTRAGGARDFTALRSKLVRARKGAHEAFLTLLRSGG